MIAGLIAFLFFLLIGTPVAYSIGIGAMVASFFDPVIPQTTVVTTFYSGINSFPLLAGVFFVLAGELMSTGSITVKLMQFCRLIIGRVRGATAHVAILASTFFAGISGAAVADLAAVGAMTTPAMKAEGYDDEFATVVPVAASVVGPIIPPSNIMIIYATCTSGSVAAMFIGGIVPGIMICLALMGFTAYLAKKRDYPVNRDPVPPAKVFMKIIGQAIPVLIMPLIVVGGVLSGVFTASESGNIAAVYALVLSLVFYHDFDLKALYKVFVSAGITIACCFLVLSTATALSWILAVNQVPQMLLRAITGVTTSPYIFLLLVNIILLVAGMFLDPGAAIILLAPILVSMGKVYGISVLHLAMIVCLNLTLGVITPPVGVCLYVGAGIGKISIEKVVHGIFPYIIIEFICILLVTYLPGISTILPSLMGLGV